MIVLAGLGLACVAILLAASDTRREKSVRNAVGIDLRYSQAPDNRVASTPAREIQRGTLSNDQFHGVGGDTLIGGPGDDTYTLWGGGNIVVEKPGEGIDTVESHVAGATLLPDNVENLVLEGDDSTYGGGNALDNVIVAGATGATLDGGGGNDVLVGGRGADVFQVRAGNGSDAVVGFAPGTDKLRLGGYGLTVFDQVRAVTSQVGADTVIALGHGERLVLRGVAAGTLTADDFQLSVDTSTMELSFGDDFSTLRTRGGGGVWLTDYGLGGTADHGLPGEQQVYVDPAYAGKGTRALGIDPFSVASNGILSITAAPVGAANAAALGGARYTSGVLTTKGAFAQRYGYFEIRAALPAGNGFLPQFWLMPAAGGWPPEIDIMESLGKDPGTIHMTTHDVGGVAIGSSAYVRDPGKMHTYGLDWTAETLTWFIDGMQVARRTTPTSMRQEMYVNLNLAVGNDWAGKVDAGTGTGSFRIDYLHIYRPISSTGP